MPGLGYWVKRQRREYKDLQEGKKSMLTGKLEKLNTIGFAFKATRRGARDLGGNSKEATPAVGDQRPDEERV